jgi:hypothetical protein
MAEKIHVVIDVPFEFAGRDQLVQFMNEKFPQADISVVRKEEVSEPQVVETLVERDPSASPAETAEAIATEDSRSVMQEAIDALAAFMKSGHSASR